MLGNGPHQEMAFCHLRSGGFGRRVRGKRDPIR